MSRGKTAIQFDLQPRDAVQSTVITRPEAEQLSSQGDVFQVAFGLATTCAGSVLSSIVALVSFPPSVELVDRVGVLVCLVSSALVGLASGILAWRAHMTRAQKLRQIGFR